MSFRVGPAFVQRTRRDIGKDWEGAHCFPKREASDETYRLSRSYRALFEKTHDFCSEIVRPGQGLGKRRQRVRYWDVLALLRCVRSSPAVAVAALESRHGVLAASEEESDFRSFVFESADDQTDDESPPSSLDERRSQKRLCHTCGAFCDPTLDLCPACQTRFDGQNSLLVVLLDMPDVRVRRRACLVANP